MKKQKKQSKKEKEAISLKIKEDICDRLGGKKFEICWNENVRYSTSVFAVNEKEAKEKWEDGDYPEPDINEADFEDDSLEVYEIPEEEWNK